jgi:hypothetical protein
MSIDLVMATEGFANRFRSEINSIYYRILQDGQVAYEHRPHHTSTGSSDQQAHLRGSQPSGETVQTRRLRSIWLRASCTA